MMPYPLSRWVTLVVVVQAFLFIQTGYSATTNSDGGLAMLEEFLMTDPSLLCHYVTCQEPVSSDACPDGTLYMEGTSQFGCCGACVAFRQEGEKCTGSIDPSYGGGYVKNQQKPTTSFMASLYNVTDNIVDSSWCDYSYMCFNDKCITDSRVENCKSMLNHYLNDIQDPTLYIYYRDDYRWKPKCTAEGKFEPKQCLGPESQQRCVCMDPDGNRIFGRAFPEQEELFKTMNCKCSRQAWEKKQAGQLSVTLHCLENGNFEPLQCEDDWCYCIDPDTGIPYGSRLSEKAMHLLPCYNKTLIGEQYLRRCESEYHAHAKVIEALDETGVNGPQTFANCDQDGSYESRQCNQELCNCKDKYNSATLCFSLEKDCQCARDKKYYMDTNSKMTVKCEVNTGSYEEVQDQTAYKYCVDEDGIRSGPLVKKSKDYTLICDEAYLCQKNGANTADRHCDKVCTFNVMYDCPLEAYPLAASSPVE